MPGSGLLEARKASYQKWLYHSESFIVPRIHNSGTSHSTLVGVQSFRPKVHLSCLLDVKEAYCTLINPSDIRYEEASSYCSDACRNGLRQEGGHDRPNND